VRREFKYLTVASLIFAFLAIFVSGVRMPWSEEGNNIVIG
jgi:hypothetical protein